MGGTLVIGAAYTAQVLSVSANYRVINEILQGVERRREQQRSQAAAAVAEDDAGAVADKEV